MISESEIIKILAGHGIRIRPNVLPLVKSQYLACVDEEECERLIEKWAKFEILDQKVLQDAQVLQFVKSDTNCEIFVIDVFESRQKMTYSSETRTFAVSRESASYLSPVQGKLSMFLERFLIARDRVKQHEKFLSKSSILSTIDSLIGCSGEKIVLGVLTKNDKNSWILEDLTSNIKLLVYDVERTSGFFCEGAIVLVQGKNVDGVLEVSCLAHPPVSWLSEEGYVGVGEKWTIPWIEHSLVITLANVHLDDPRILTLLDKLFLGYSEFTNVLFIFIGNFSEQKEPDPYKYPAMFEELIKTIAKYEKLLNTAMWVFVPGPNDPGFGDFLPRQKIPNFFVDAVQNLQNWKIVSNPCKVSFCGKKIFVARCEQLRKMQRSSVCEINYEENEAPEFHLVQTLLRQAHVSPGLGMKVLPDFDYALRIDQKVDFLCIAESSKGFVYEVEGVVAFNPGHFSRYASFFVMSGKELAGELCDLEGR